MNIHHHNEYPSKKCENCKEALVYLSSECENCNVIKDEYFCQNLKCKKTNKEK